MFTKPIFKPEKAWGYSSRDDIRSVITIRDMVIFGTAGNSIISLNLDGEQLWKFRTDDEVSSLGTFGNMILGGSKDGKLFCIDTLGNLLWQYETGGSISAIVQYNDLIIAGSIDKNVYCLDSQGHLFWKNKIGGSVHTVDVIHDFVLAGTGDNHLYCIGHNGKQLWKVKTEGPVITALPFGNLILGITNNDYLYCSDLDGNLEWKLHFPEGICSVTTNNDQVFLGLGDNELQIIDGQGQLMKKLEVHGPIVSMIVSADLLFAGSRDKYLYCLTIDGTILWKKRTGNPVSYVRSNDGFILVQSGKRIVAHTTSVVPVFIAIEKQIREGRIKFTNIYEAEQLFELAKHAFQQLENEKAGRLLNKVKNIIHEHNKKVKQFEKELSVHKPDYTIFDGILESEYRDKVVLGINSARGTISEIQGILTTLLGKRANIETTLMKQKDDKTINALIVDYRDKLRRAKDREKMSVARSYAFMIVNQRRKLQMKEKMRKILVGIDEQIRELSDFSKDLFENANEMPHDADLVGAFGILNNEAVHAINDANKLIGDINKMETELNEVAIESELSGGRDHIEIDELHADVRSEIEKELE